MDLPFAEDINYWKSGKSSPDSWLDKAEKIIIDLGGKVFTRAMGRLENKKAFLIDFEIQNDKFRIIFPVLPTRSDDVKSAERQAATLLYHDVKSKALKTYIFGARIAFFDYLLLENGQSITQLDNIQLSERVPKLLTN